MPKRPQPHLASFLALVALLALAACDPGSRSDITPLDEDACKVNLTSNADGYALEMVLGCEGAKHTKCYNIKALECGGKKVELSAPVAIKSCPGGAWCVDDCVSVEAPGNLWDVPGLQEKGCKIYGR